MRTLFTADVIDSRYMSRTLSLASFAELLNSWAECVPAVASGGK